MNPDKIVSFWHAVELLQPQAIPKIEKRDLPHQPLYQKVSVANPSLPWSAGNRLAREKKDQEHVWSHSLYGYLYDSSEVHSRLEAIFGATNGYREPQQKKCGLFFLKIDANGLMIADSLVLSSEAWFLARVLAGKEWNTGFDEDQNRVRQRAQEAMSGTITDELLNRLTDYILNFLGLRLVLANDGKREHLFRSAPVNPSWSVSEDDPLNSFLLDDLGRVQKDIAARNINPTLQAYLSVNTVSDRIDIRDRDNSYHILKKLSPSEYSPGCWPSENHYGLVHSQQLAVNHILQSLKNSPGLIGVNGPPGTGKTTLLRDLIAAIVTARADALATFNRASDAFQGDAKAVANDNGTKQVAYKLKPELFGFEIVVASSNNGAVENITLELPQKERIDSSWLGEVDFFPDLAQNLTGKPAWGLVSAALGAKSKRSTFVDKFFYGNGMPDKVQKPEPQSNAESDNELATESASSSAKPQKGLNGWLSGLIEANVEPKERLRIWSDVVAQYQAAKDAEAKISAKAKSIVSVTDGFLKHFNEYLRLEGKVKLTKAEAELAQREAATYEAKNLVPVLERRNTLIEALADHDRRIPTFWEKLFSLWAAQRRWNDTRKFLKRNFNLIVDEIAMHRTQAENLKHAYARLVATLNCLEADAVATKGKRDAAKSLAQEIAKEFEAWHVLKWLESAVLVNDPHLEIRDPWKSQKWRKARAKVFLQALKLHKTFFELEAARVKANIKFATSVLTSGKYRGMPRDALRSAWATLFMAVPVLSSTFASFSRSFASLGRSEIGWLMIDEAGQATPQAAVGALWRSERAVVVGDPLQLEPILSVSDASLEYMRHHFELNPHWLPNRQSTQTLADQATNWGSMVGPRGKKCWVGLPLVVHRRCAKTMFDIANTIAYDGAMIHGTATLSEDKRTKASLKTGWIDVQGPSTGNWVPAEGVALKTLLSQLVADGVPIADISVITPFQAVRQHLFSLLPRGMTFGTIHTMQGKESAVVIMILGGNSAGDGARNWAVSKPNLLNVAATRAKERFYVIGDRANWARRNLFCDVIDWLPTVS